MRTRTSFLVAPRVAALPGAAAIAALLAAAGPARAQTASAPDTTGAPPPDASALVSAPTAPADAPDMSRPAEGTTATLSAGGQMATGNSQLLAGTVNGTFSKRFGDNGVGASLLGNYGQGAPHGQTIVETTENLQGRARYDRYVSDRVGLFGIVTGRHDKFEGLDFRLNLDPGVQYLFVTSKATTLWTEVGYDYQYDINSDLAIAQTDANGNTIRDAEGNPVRNPLLPKTAADHSARLFVGFKHAFNDRVTLSTGIEYLQSFLAETNYDHRINFDALFASQIGGGLSLGLGFSARYDYQPLPGKADTDTATTLTLIYSYSDIPAAPKPCAGSETPEPPPANPAPSGPAPAPATAPATAPSPSPSPTP